MQRKYHWLVFALLVILCSCTSGKISPPVRPTPSITYYYPSDTKVPLPTISPIADTPIPTYYDPVDRLSAIIEVSDPTSPTYHLGSVAYTDFPETLKQLAALNSSSNNAASMLAYAMGFPRQDSILAAQAVISLGPDWAGTLLPGMIDYLTNQRPDIRMYSAIILSTTGNKGTCSLGNIGPVLWDPDPYVRSSAALAIQAITGLKLVPDRYMITSDQVASKPVTADIPEGVIVGAARIWWTDHGSKVNWHPSYDGCDP